MHIIKNCLVLSFGGGYEAFPILKILAIFVIILLTIIYNKISNLYSLRNVFLGFLSLSIILLFIFAFMLSDNFVQNDLSAGKTIIKMWNISLFYILSDFWTAAIGGLLFWKMINTAFNHKQAENNYNFFISIGNVGMIISGMLGYFIAYNLNPKILVQNLSEILIFCMIICIFLIHNVENKFLISMRIDHMKNKSHTPPLDTYESIRFIMNSKYLLAMLCIAIIFNVTSVIIDNPFQKVIQTVFLNLNEQFQFVSILNIIMGICAICINIFSKNLFHHLGWKFSALTTPLFIGIISITFMLSIYFQFHMSIILIIGITQFIGMLSLKFSLFVFTFEMLYVPLDLEAQKKGKLAISVFASRLGKSLGALLLIAIMSFSNYIIYIPFIVIALIIAWTYLINSIYLDYQKLITKEHVELK